MASQCNYKASVKFLKEALNLLRLKPDLDVSPLVCGEYPKSKMIARCMTVLGLPRTCYAPHEFSFECNKLNYLSKIYDLPISDSTDVLSAFSQQAHKLF